MRCFFFMSSLSKIGMPYGLLIALAVAAATLVAQKRRVFRIPFRHEAGLFSNLLLRNMEYAMCYPQHRLECAGWPIDVRALLPWLPRDTGAESDELPSHALGSACYLGNDPRLLMRPCFEYTRLRLSAMVAPGGMFAPADDVRALARSWWKSELGDAHFVVGIHGRAALHYDDGALDLERHVRLLGDEAAEEIRVAGTRLLLASCNASIVAQLRARFGAALAWREPEGDINTGNFDWGGAKQQVTAEIAKGALVDSLLLSMCDVVVCGSSNVMVYAAALRPAMRIRVARHLADVRGH